jgi:hypothetical protein
VGDIAIRNIANCTNNPKNAPSHGILKGKNSPAPISDPEPHQISTTSATDRPWNDVLRMDSIPTPIAIKVVASNIDLSEKCGILNPPDSRRSQ